MSISTYAELQSTIGDWLNRDDLTAVIPTFITLAEARINRELRHFNMEARSPLTIDARYIDVPSDWLATIRIQVAADKTYDLELVSQNDMAQMREQSGDAAGRPRFYALTAGQIEMYPTPGESHTGEIVYYGSVPALSDSAPPNWLLTKYPDIYLYGSLLQSAPYLDEDQRTTTWAALYQSAIDAANMDSDKARHSGTGLRMLIRSY